jgi:hypothetical protein
MWTCLTTVATAAFLAATPSLPALAFGGCGANHPAVGGNESFSRIGNRASVLVNDMTQDHSHNTWRSVLVWQNNNYSAEVGWYSDTSDDSADHPYKTWVSDGIPHTQSFGNVVISPEGEQHTFKVHDQNGDQQWSFAWDGNALGNQSVSMTEGLPLNESERCNNSDNLWAIFKDLQRLACEQCGWQDYSNLSKFVNNTSDFKFCKNSATDFRVKQSC